MSFIMPPPLHPGDKIAILSLSAGLPHLYPHVYELGLKRLREVFHLEPVEYPSARKSPSYLETHPEKRAEDFHQALLDPSIKGILATVGGLDQIRILSHIDPHILSHHPKRFFGYSDNTNLHLLFWNLGMVSYYGGHLMNQLAMNKEMNKETMASLKEAFFGTSEGILCPFEKWTDADLDWADVRNLDKSRPFYPQKKWEWWNEKQTLEGRLWGGCLEILDLHLSIKKHLPTPHQLEGCILCLETSEEMPSSGFVYRFLAALGELGLLQKFKALLVGIPKAQFLRQLPSCGREEFFMEQKLAIQKALHDYKVAPLVVFNLSFGHTDPQIILPLGKKVSIDGIHKTISFIQE